MILIVEDDGDIRESLRYAIEMEGFRVAAACNGQEAMALLQAIDRPCLILLDLMMPVMNGWQFLKMLTREIPLATIPVVIVSAIHDTRKPFGAFEFIKKPVDLERLLTLVHQHCD